MNKLYLFLGAIIALVVLFIVWETVLFPFFGPKGKVTINNHTFTVDVAKNDKDREKGLSGRRSLSEKNGMLFLMDAAGYPGFWMKGMKFPIDIVYINDKKIVTIYKNVPNPTSTSPLPPVYRPTAPADKVLEIKAGLSDSYSIKEGDTVSISL